MWCFARQALGDVHTSLLKLLKAFLNCKKILGSDTVFIPLLVGCSPFLRVVPGGNLKPYFVFSKPACQELALETWSLLCTQLYIFRITKSTELPMAQYKAVCTSLNSFLSTNFWYLFGCTCWCWVSLNKRHRTENSIKIAKQEPAIAAQGLDSCLVSSNR